MDDLSIATLLQCILDKVELYCPDLIPAQVSWKLTSHANGYTLVTDFSTLTNKRARIKVALNLHTDNAAQASYSGIWTFYPHLKSATEPIYPIYIGSV